jgi:amino acid transporter
MTDKKVDYNVSSGPESDQDVSVGETAPIETPKDGEYHRSISARQMHVSSNLYHHQQSIRNLSPQVISLGGQIGAGLFISSGKNLRDGGPASLFLAFFVVCTCVFAVLQTVSEMTISFPVSGNFIDYADRFVDPAFAFAAGFSMWLGWTAIIAAEATFFSVVVNYWAQGKVHEAVWCKQ